MANQRSNTKLEKDEFASAIRKGLGRALIHVINFGLNDIDDIVLDACIHNYCHDTQLESSRASWLFRMFANSGYYPEFSEAILDRLRTETNSEDLMQLCALAKEIAKQGDENARQRLKEIVFKKASTRSSDDWIGSYEWIELEGTQGFLELARVYGQRLLQNSEDFVPDDIVHAGKTENEFKDILFRFAETDQQVKAYKDYLEASGVFKPRSGPIDRELIRQQQHERTRKELNLEGILKDAKNKLGNFPGRYMRFGKHATPEELKKVYGQLFLETDKDVLLRLLWVFRCAPLPRLDKIFFNWAKGIDHELRAATINALAQLSAPEIHHLAVSKVRAGELLGADSDVLDLFLNNLEESDIRLITQALRLLTPDMDDAHSLGYSVLDLSKKWAKVELTEALKWVYENTPCSNCRYRVIEQLHEWQKLDDAILYECQFDAEEDIRALAKEIVK